MATYAIGDVQGCWDELDALFSKISLKKSDQVWLAGDLINRGPKSLQVLREVRAMGDRARVVLGNHDLHFLAILFGGHKAHSKDTFDNLLDASDVEELGHWLRRQPLLHADKGYLMVHAGIPPQWSTKQALRYAREVETVMADDCPTGASTYRKFFTHIYGNEPDCWSKSFTGMKRWRAIVNFLTRMRMIDLEGRLDFSYKGAVNHSPEGLLPWFEHPETLQRKRTVLFGHWASLNGATSNPQCMALDTGCVWGRSLTAFCLETGTLTCQQALA